jgi:hypothetical protein
LTDWYLARGNRSPARNARNSFKLSDEAAVLARMIHEASAVIEDSLLLELSAGRLANGYVD